MDRLELQVKIREGTGKGAGRRLRAQGRVPAVVYGSGSENVRLDVDAGMLNAVLRRGTNQIIDLKGPAKFKSRLVLVKECQRDPVSHRVLHCDFYQVDTHQKIEVQVPVYFEGKARGVEMGGVLEPLLREIEVSCLPLSIPEQFSIDVSELDIGDGLRVSDLELPEAVELLTELSAPLVHVIAPRIEAEEVAEAEVPAEVEGEAAPAEGAPAEETSTAEEGSGE